MRKLNKNDQLSILLVISALLQIFSVLFILSLEITWYLVCMISSILIIFSTLIVNIIQGKKPKVKKIGRIISIVLLLLSIIFAISGGFWNRVPFPSSLIVFFAGIIIAMAFYFASSEESEN